MQLFPLCGPNGRARATASQRDRNVKLQLGYRDPNVHELIVHELALRLGEYERRGVVAEAVDGATHPMAPMSAGLGGCAVEHVRQIRLWAVLYVNTIQPLFWLRASTGTTPRGLVGQRVAVHPDGSVVRFFTDAVLGRLGVDPEDVTFVPYGGGPAGDIARLEALASGEVVAAVIGSSVAPAAAEARGFPALAFFGEVLSIPTTGLAVDRALLDPGDPRLRAVVAAQRAARAALGERPAEAAAVVRDLLAVGDLAHAIDFVDRYLTSAYDVQLEDAAKAGAAFLWSLRERLDIAAPPVDLYQLQA